MQEETNLFAPGKSILWSACLRRCCLFSVGKWRPKYSGLYDVDHLNPTPARILSAFRSPSDYNRCVAIILATASCCCYYCCLLLLLLQPARGLAGVWRGLQESRAQSRPGSSEVSVLRLPNFCRRHRPLDLNRWAKRRHTRTAWKVDTRTGGGEIKTKGGWENRTIR